MLTLLLLCTSMAIDVDETDTVKVSVKIRRERAIERFGSPNEEMNGRELGFDHRRVLMLKFDLLGLC